MQQNYEEQLRSVRKLGWTHNQEVLGGWSREFGLHSFKIISCQTIFRINYNVLENGSQLWNLTDSVDSI